MWAASWNEIFEYVTLREGLQIGKRSEGRDVIFTVTLPTTDGFQYEEISLLLTGAGSYCNVTPQSANIAGPDTRFDARRQLLNVRYGSRFEALSEKYTLRYERTLDEEIRADSACFAGLLLPELARPYQERIAAAAAIPKSGPDQVTRSGAEEYRAKYDGYEYTVRRRIAAGGKQAVGHLFYFGK